MFFDVISEHHCLLTQMTFPSIYQVFFKKEENNKSVGGMIAKISNNVISKKHQPWSLLKIESYLLTCLLTNLLKVKVKKFIAVLIGLTVRNL